MEGQKECLEMWKAEAETQSKRSMQKQLPFACKKVETNDRQLPHTQRTTGKGHGRYRNKREFQMMPVSFVTKADTGGVIVTETPACWREIDAR